MRGRSPARYTRRQGDSERPPSKAANGQRGMLELTSLEMFELFLSSGITEPIALHLFSGEPDRADGFAAILKASRVPCLEIDTLVDVRADVSHDHIFELLCALASRGLIIFALIGIPCNTWSVARIGSTFYPFQLRSRTGINGLVKGLTFKQRLEVRLADELGRRAFALAKILDRLRYAFLFEHPVDRGNRRATWFQEKFKDHVSIFATSFAIAFLSQTEVEKVDFCQCACGSVFQKRTTAVASKRIASAMDELRRAQCTHTGPNAHSEQAIGFDKSGKSISARSAPYPAGLNSILAGIAAWWFTQVIASHGMEGRACDNNQQPLVGLYIGSAKPHAVENEAREAIVSPAQRISSASLRRLEPEIVEVLRFEPLPAVNVMPCSEAPAPEVELRPIPRPLTTDELIPKAMQQRLHQHRRQVAACFDRARRGGWKWARDHRPEPLVATEAEAMLPAGWGWKWEYNEETLKWLAMTPSSWPESPPDTTLEIDNLLEWALENKPEDKAIISYMSNGYPGPSLEPVATIGSLHVGALKGNASSDTCYEKTGQLT